MGQLIPFDFEEQAVRVHLADDGDTWFNAGDVCGALEFGNSRQAIASHVDQDDVQKLDVIDSLGRMQQANYVNESGLYALIFGSTKESAKRFKRWVTHDVLPTLRKTGSYNMRGATATINQQLGAHKLRLQLLDLLAAETDGAKRAAIHQQLAHASDLLGIPTPALADIGREASNEPWLVEVLEVLLRDVRNGSYPFPTKIEPQGDDQWLLLRPTHCIAYLGQRQDLRSTYARIPVKSARALLLAMQAERVVVQEDAERTIGRQRAAHLVALSLNQLRTLGVDVPDMSVEVGK
jgi:prophage antirepressor-like protein